MELSAASQAALDHVSAAFRTSGLSVSDYIIALLENQTLAESPCTINLVNNAKRIIKAFSCHPYSQDLAFDWATATIQKKYSQSIKNLVAREQWHFNASHASAQELENFQIEDMALKMKELAPDLWLMLDILLVGNRKHPVVSTGHNGDHVMSNTENSDTVPDVFDEKEVLRSKVQKDLARREALCTIVC